MLFSGTKKQFVNNIANLLKGILKMIYDSIYKMRITRNICTVFTLNICVAFEANLCFLHLIYINVLPVHFNLY